MSESNPLRVSALIPNWNGGERLLACVASLRRELAATLDAEDAPREDASAWEIIVADDASPLGESDLARLREAFAEDEKAGRLKLFRRPQNGGFGATVNDAAKQARGAFLLLANNDLMAQRGFVEELLRPFDLPGGERVAVASARTEALDGSANHVAMFARWRGGRVALDWEDPSPSVVAPTSAKEYREADFFQGGSALVRREAWDAAGGFDELFSPGYWEDYDLASRLRARGWRIVYAPRARAFHIGKASMAQKYSPGGVRDMIEAHQLLWELRHGPRGFLGRGRWIVGVALDVGREWARGGPFHQTRGLRGAWRKRWR
jgi:GT2 family glycosyltransferase